MQDYPPDTSLTRSAPASTAFFATSAFLVSTEIGQRTPAALKALAVGV